MHTPDTLHAMPSPRNPNRGTPPVLTLYGPEPIGAAGAIPLADVFNTDTAARLTACWNACNGMATPALGSMFSGELARMLQRCEAFIAGFEDDAMQEGIPALLADLRAVIGDKLLTAPAIPCGIDGEPLDGTTGYDVHYSCPNCEHEWSAQWSCACDEDCPECGTTCEAASHQLDGTATQESLDAYNAMPA